MKIKYLGHAAFLINDLLIDPFITGNPLSPIKPEDITCNVVCVTHDHGDHLGDAFEVTKRNNAVFVSIYELSQEAQKYGIKTEGMNIGGEIEIGDWKIKMVLAFHSSNLGAPIGFILKNLKENKSVYHAGDTGLFSDMKLIGEEGIDVALLPIGDRFTMGIKDAIKAVQFINPSLVIPMHYNTFPGIKVDVNEFVKNSPKRSVALKPGEEIEI